MNKSILMFLGPLIGWGLGYYAGSSNENKLSKKEVTTNIVTTEVKKQDISTVQAIQKDSTTVQQTNREIVSYSHTGKVRKREFIETHYGTKTQIGTQTSLNSVVLDSSFSDTKTNTIETYQSNWALIMNYQIKLDSWNFDYRNVEFGLGYRLIGNLYGTVQTNTQFNLIKIGGILLL